MTMIKKITNEAQKQRISRNIRADCNGDLVVLALLSGAEIRFTKTKMSSSAKKVYVGDKVMTRNMTHSFGEILEDGVLFECAMRRIWNEKRVGTNNELRVNNALIASHTSQDETRFLCKEKLPALETDRQTDPNFVLWGKSSHSGSFGGSKEDESINNSTNSKEPKENGCCLRKRKTKNKEAAFNNYLSYFLVKNGIDVSCQVVARKLTLRTLHFFIWKKYILPNGKVVKTENLEPITTLLRNAISGSHILSHTSTINRNTLFDIGVTKELLINCGLDYFIDRCIPESITPSTPQYSHDYSHHDTISSIPHHQYLSVFKPCSKQMYSIIQSVF